MNIYLAACRLISDSVMMINYIVDTFSESWLSKNVACEVISTFSFSVVLTPSWSGVNTTLNEEVEMTSQAMFLLNQDSEKVSTI